MSTANSVASGLDCASPESIMDPTNLTPIGDQYSLGCTLYFCLSGSYPFPDGTAAEKMMAHQFKQPRPLGDMVPLPAELLAVVERLMQKDPAARYASIAEVIEALRPFAATVTPVPQSTRKPDVARSHAAPKAAPPAPRAEPKPAPRPRVEAPPPRPSPAPASLPSRQPAPASVPSRQPTPTNMPSRQPAPASVPSRQPVRNVAAP